MPKTKKKSDTNDTPPLVQGTEDERQKAEARAEACLHEIEAVLRKHRCDVVPFLGQPEFVGDREKMLIAARYAIVPRP